MRVMFGDCAVKLNRLPVERKVRSIQFGEHRTWWLKQVIGHFVRLAADVLTESNWWPEKLDRALNALKRGHQWTTFVYGQPASFFKWKLDACWTNSMSQINADTKPPPQRNKRKASGRWWMRCDGHQSSPCVVQNNGPAERWMKRAVQLSL